MKKFRKWLRFQFGVRVRYLELSSNKVEEAVLITYTSAYYAERNDIIHFAVIERRNNPRHIILPLMQIEIIG